jgi:thioredoxin 1
MVTLTSDRPRLTSVATILELEAGEELADVLPETGPAVVYFYRNWSEPCVVTGNRLGRVDTSVPVVAVDADDRPTTADAYGVESVPTLVFVRDGEPVGRHVGPEEYDRLERLVEEHT